jgi:hypothetical protein
VRNLGDRSDSRAPSARRLRCDSWLPFAAPSAPTIRHPPPRQAIALPPRGKALRDKIVLRAIAVDRRCTSWS